jgi:hypothetical protein
MRASAFWPLRGDALVSLYGYPKPFATRSSMRLLACRIVGAAMSQKFPFMHFCPIGADGLHRMNHHSQPRAKAFTSARSITQIIS